MSGPDDSSVARNFPFSIRDLVWLASFVAAGAWGYINLGYKIDTQEFRIAAAADRNAQAVSYLEGRLVEVRSQLDLLNVSIQTHLSAPGHAVALERTAELQTRVTKLEVEIGAVRQNKHVDFKTGDIELPGRRIHYMHPTDEPRLTDQRNDNLFAPLQYAWRWITRQHTQ